MFPAPKCAEAENRHFCRSWSQFSTLVVSVGPLTDALSRIVRGPRTVIPIWLLSPRVSLRLPRGLPSSSTRANPSTSSRLKTSLRTQLRTCNSSPLASALESAHRELSTAQKTKNPYTARVPDGLSESAAGSHNSPTRARTMPPAMPTMRWISGGRITMLGLTVSFCRCHDELPADAPPAQCSPEQIARSLLRCPPRRSAVLDGRSSSWAHVACGDGLALVTGSLGARCRSVRTARARPSLGHSPALSVLPTHGAAARTAAPAATADSVVRLVGPRSDRQSCAG